MGRVQSQDFTHLQSQTKSQSTIKTDYMQHAQWTPDMPELRLQSLSALYPFSFNGVVRLTSSLIVSLGAQLQDMLLHSHELPSSAMVAPGTVQLPAWPA